MAYTLLITEKPQAAKKIAEALADGKAIKEAIQGVPYYRVTHKNEDIVVACAVGHLYGLAEKGKKTWKFPVFDIEWKPSSEISKDSAFTKKYAEAIKKLAKEANKIVVATDYDVEGEVIGLNIVTHLCRKKDAHRMKFSTLTKDELALAFEKKSPHLDWGQAKAGETRHYLDFYNGINYSRALTHAIKTTGSFKLMSTGRVQGPALKIIVHREKEIRAFKPVPFWQISILGEKNGEFLAWHEKDKFWDNSEADAAFENVKGQKSALVESAEKKQFAQQPPHPFDLTTLQMEAYRALGVQPKTTLEIAQNLYIAGAISYPRTSSQKLPESIGFRKVLKELAKQKEYTLLANSILSKSPLKPHEGEKTDPAHPAIFPTGVAIGFDDEKEGKIYDLIVKRFLATFSDPATRETSTIHLDCNRERFVAKGTRTVKKGWHEFYAPYADFEEEEIPALSKGERIEVKKTELLSKETQPPKRYTPASIIKELEKKNLGTKATRSDIVDTLFRRGYVDGRSIQATELGVRTIETLEKYAPKIIDEELTAHFEEEMEKIREGKTTQEKILDEAKDALIKIITDFKKSEKDIGKELALANIETRNELSGVGKCPNCKEGDLQIRKGRFGGFIACNKYPDCKTTFSLPKGAFIKPAKKECAQCGYPLVLSIKKAKQPQEYCINPNCPSKIALGKAGEEMRKIEQGEIKKSCPKCKDGQVVVRKSIYGMFLGCSNYPKCKHTEHADGSENKKDFNKNKTQKADADDAKKSKTQ